MEFDIKPSYEAKHPDICSKNSINLYRTVPFGTLTLEECQDLFRQRIEAHTIIEKNDITGDNISVISNLMRGIKSYVYKTNCIIIRTNDEQQRRLDHLSHMLVRMYCIYHSNLWDRFKNCEKKMLYYRLRDQAASLTSTQLEDILQSFNFNFKRVTGAELDDLYKENLIGWSLLVPNKRESIDIFKVPFTKALKFLAKRSVSLKKGFAFLTRHEIISVVCDAFESHLDNELVYAKQHLNLELFQTQQLLESLDMVHAEHLEKLDEEKRIARTANERGQNPYSIDIHNLDILVKNHYPPCMRYMHDALMADHHLKHQARIYYGAFLRSGGVDMDSAIEFWRGEFTKKIPNDKFDRDYKYNIRHLYGKEGHKKALSCFSCDKIINDNAPGPSEKHGCPFKHFDDNHLKAMLSSHGLKSVDIESIVGKRADKEYRLACSEYFRYTRGELPTEPIKNPIHFYYESQRQAHQPKKTDEDDFDDDMEMLEAIKG